MSNVVCKCCQIFLNPIQHHLQSEKLPVILPVTGAVVVGQTHIHTLLLVSGFSEMIVFVGADSHWLVLRLEKNPPYQMWRIKKGGRKKTHKQFFFSIHTNIEKKKKMVKSII